eukprot:snap_masked-scaffold_21-processed-gene-5.41-mRNA-1 protein AED:1.00 eAED:1.00 QI:0/-1/0/0/-1/1/1/0/588
MESNSPDKETDVIPGTPAKATEQDPIPSNSSNQTPLPVPTQSTEDFPHTRSKGTQSLFGSDVLESLDRVTRERKKMEKMLQEMDLRKKDLQMIETSITEKHDAFKQDQISLKEKAQTKEKVPEVKNEKPLDLPPEEAYSNTKDDTETFSEMEEELTEKLSKKDDESRALSDNNNAITEVDDKSNYTLVSSSNPDPWSETGSDVVDKFAWKKKHGAHQFEYNPPQNSVGGFPLVQFPLPEKLKDLTAPSIDSFLHEFKTISQCVPTLTVQSLLSKKAADALELRGVDMSSGRNIIQYLTQHLQKSESRKRFTCLSQLEKTLRWPTAKMSVDDQVYEFFDSIFQCLKYLDEQEMKTHNKRILKIIFKKLPEVLNYSLDEFVLTSKSKSLSSLKRIIMSRRHSLVDNSFAAQRVEVKKESRHLPKQRNVTRKIKASTSSNTVTSNSSTKTSKPEVSTKNPTVSRLGDKATRISLQLYHPGENKMIPVKGITDTGSDLNVANLKKLEPFILSSEPPRKIKNIKFPNDTMVPVLKVSRVKVTLVQENFKLDLGTVLFFVVDSPIWNDVIIGVNTLEENGVTLQLKHAPKCEEK